MVDDFIIEKKKSKTHTSLIGKRCPMVTSVPVHKRNDKYGGRVVK